MTSLRKGGLGNAGKKNALSTPLSVTSRWRMRIQISSAGAENVSVVLGIIVIDAMSGFVECSPPSLKRPASKSLARVVGHLLPWFSLVADARSTSATTECS